ncbi:hypothetical protein JCM5350_001372 [Sporobolomyces pararoseus]
MFQFSPSLGSISRLELLSPSPSELQQQQQQQQTQSVSFTWIDEDESLDSTTTVEVWTNLPNSSSSNETTEEEWHAVPFLLPTTDNNSQVSPNNNKKVAIVEVPYSIISTQQSSFEFTYRIRHRDGSIEWLGSQGANGKIEFFSPPPPKVNKTEWKSESGGKVKKARFGARDGEGLSLFDVTETVENWRNGQQVQGMTLEQSSRTWFTPRPFPPSLTPLSHISKRFVSQLILLETVPSPENDNSRYLCIFPFTSKSFNCSLIGGENDKLLVRCESDAQLQEGREEEEKGGIVISNGNPREDTFDDSIRLAVESARQSLHPSTATTSPVSQESTITPSPPKDLTLCTWNALGPDFTLTSLLSWLDRLLSPSNTSKAMIESFKRGGLMLDDGWQNTCNFKGEDQGDELRGLKGFGVREGWYDLNHERQVERGKELKDAVDRIKAKGIERVGVWITITGYWNCLHPDFSDESETFETILATFTSPQHDNFHFSASVPSLSSLRRFFKTYFSRIKSSGIEFIKIDNQALVDSIVKLSDDSSPGAYRAELLSVIEEESAATFGKENVIHCMAHSTRIWSGPFALSPSSSSSYSVSTQKPTLRNSDDYFPNEPDSHRWHVYINSINLLLTRHLETFSPDLDMTQERHEWGSFHLALRAFSTAGIWSTDGIVEEEGERLGEKKNGWKSLLATTLGGGVRVLQARDQAGSILPSQVLSREITERGEKGGEALKVGLSCAQGRGGTIGIWNCQKEGRVTNTLTRKDVWEAVRGWEPNEDLVVLVDESFGPTPSLKSFDSAPPTIQVLESDSINPTRRLLSSMSQPFSTVELPSRAVQIATIAELHKLKSTTGATIRIACLGLRDKFVGIEAVRKVSVVAQAQTMKEEEAKSKLLSQGTLSGRSKPDLITSSSPSFSSNGFPSPPPGTHLPFLFTYFSNLFVNHGTNNHSSTSTATQPRKPSTELSLLFKSLLRRPISTLFTEVRGVFTFGIAVVVWAFRSRQRASNEGQSSKNKLVENGIGALEEAKEKAEETPIRSVPSSVFRVELEFISSQVAFYFSPTLKSTNEIEFKLDGKVIEEKYVHLRDLGIVEVDVEGCWRENGKRTKLGSKVWLVEVAYKG